MSIPTLAVTLGDVAGIGPEITAKSLLGHDDVRQECRPVVIGDEAAMRQGVRNVGGDPDKVILMGHSAGAHLVALLGADPAQLRAAGARRPLGVVSLDSAAMDVPPETRE